MPNGGSRPRLRERNKARTRAELIAVSQRLFQTLGYQATTLDLICEEVGIAPQTLLRYFGSKQLLALAPQIEAFEQFRARLHEPGRDVDTLTAWSEHIQTIASPEDIVSYFRLIESDPTLKALQQKLFLDYEELLADQFAHEAGADPNNHLASSLLAAMLVGATYIELRRWLRSRRTGDLNERFRVIIDHLAANYLPLLDDSRVKKRPWSVKR